MLDKVRKVFKNDRANTRQKTHDNTDDIDKLGLGDVLYPPNQKAG